METKEGSEIYAVYKSFKLGDAASQYQITINNYSGTAGTYIFNCKAFVVDEFNANISNVFCLSYNKVLLIKTFCSRLMCKHMKPPPHYEKTPDTFALSRKLTYSYHLGYCLSHTFLTGLHRKI